MYYDYKDSYLILPDKLLSVLSKEECKSVIAHELDHYANRNKAKKFLTIKAKWFEASLLQWNLHDKIQDISTRFNRYLEFSADDRAAKLYGAETSKNAMVKMIKATLDEHPEYVRAFFSEKAPDDIAKITSDEITHRLEDMSNGHVTLDNNLFSDRLARLRQARHLPADCGKS